MAKKGKYVYEWPRPMVAADSAIFRFFSGRARLLLVNRKYEPYKGKWCLPGGFVNLDEELIDAAARELAEETGLTGVRLEQVHAFGALGRDPRGRVITITFMGTITKGRNKPKAGDDAAKARWFDIEKLPEDLAFDHNEVVRLVIKKLKRKKIYRLNTKRRRKNN
ncbi:MAG: NUDIX hydrolase [Phycisphaerae bacterium]|nr:NUDIX hydrolase [Phycisphaerae bacterium]